MITSEGRPALLYKKICEYLVCICGLYCIIHQSLGMDLSVSERVSISVSLLFGFFVRFLFDFCVAVVCFCRRAFMKFDALNLEACGQTWCFDMLLRQVRDFARWVVFCAGCQEIPNCDWVKSSQETTG